MEKNQVTCEIKGEPVPFNWNGRYVLLEKVEKGKTLTVRFPLEEKTVKNRIHGIPYTIRVKGFNVVDMYPRNMMYAFFDDPNYLQNQTLWKTVSRFVPDEEGYW